MFARLALESDLPAIIELARSQVAETLPHLPFDPEVVAETFQRYLDKANPTIFVVEDRREVVGFLMALLADYAFCHGHFASQEVIYVRPDRRGTRAAARLIKLFNEWADRTGALEVFMGVANGFNVERTARFMQSFGFAPVGQYLRRVREVDHGKGR